MTTAAIKSAAIKAMKSDEASRCAILRDLSKKNKSATRGEFLEVFTAAPFKMSERTVSRQFYEGRGAKPARKTKAKSKKAK